MYQPLQKVKPSTCIAPCMVKTTLKRSGKVTPNYLFC